MLENVENEKMRTMIEEAVANAIAPYLAPQKRVLLTREAVSQRLNVDKSTLYRWDRSGYLSVSAHIGGRCFYDEAAIRRLESGIIDKNG